MSLVIWFSVFFSPTGYLLLMLLANKFHISAPPDAVVWSLFLLIPVVALLVCGTVAWFSGKTMLGRIGRLACTVSAMVIQFGVILVLLRAILVTAIGYAQ